MIDAIAALISLGSVSVFEVYMPETKQNTFSIQNSRNGLILALAHFWTTYLNMTSCLSA